LHLVFHFKIMKTFYLIASLLISLTVTAGSPKIVDYTSKVNFGHRPAQSARNVDIIVVHSTHCLDGDQFDVNRMLAVFRSYNVCSHYIIDRKGVIYLLVAEKEVAFHAGKSVLPQNGRKYLNNTSIGIELLNSPTEAPTEQQYQALASLIRDIKTRYTIQYIVGHSDIAHKRKTDPWLFDWGKLNNMIN
jgi:N-acetyl-anhydromuramyl-L-alanine amidase AmpD